MLLLGMANLEARALAYSVSLGTRLGHGLAYPARNFGESAELDARALGHFATSVAMGARLHTQQTQMGSLIE